MKHRLSIALVVSACLMALASTASAALPSAGTIVKGSGSAVYWYSKDGKRYVFPNEKTYKTWYADFSGVVTISDAELASLQIGGNVTYRPGVKLVKIVTDPKTYAVDSHGTLRWVTSEALAAQLYGSDWNTKVDDVPDAFFVNYAIGAQIDAASQYSPTAATASATDIDKDLAASSCTADAWSCGDWGACTSGGIQTRSCTMTFDCPGVSTPSPAVSQACTPPSDLPALSGSNDDGLVIAGTRNVILAKFNLTAQTESLKLTKVRISLVDPSSAVDVLRLRLYDGATPVSGDAIMGSDGNADFSGVEFVIPRNETKTLTVAADLNTISSGARTGDQVSVLMHVPAVDDGTYELRGVNSGTVLHSGSGGDKTAFQKILRKTVPTVANAALPTSTLTNGDVVASRFTVAADAADQLSLKKLTFNVSKSDAVGITSPALRLTGSGSDLAAAATLDPACAASAGSVCTLSLVLADEQEIAAGTSKTYELHLTVSGASGPTSVLTNLLGDTALVTGALSNSGQRIAGTSYDFIWSDDSGVPHDDADASSADWTDGQYVKVVPNDVQALTKS